MIVAPTPEQQKVVDYPLEPLRVTAGAGTGKTTTMALRLSALILREGLEPEEALGITFTNKAAEELADRLREYLGDLSEAGRQVEVTTYHGFANSILAEFGPLVGVERGMAVITPGYTRQLLRDALGAAPRRFLDLTAPGPRVDELAVLAGQLGDHLAGPADLAAAAVPEDEVAGERAEMGEVLAAYAARKARLGAIDYADMIALAHRLLSTHPEVAGRIRERYRAVLLDEYQDTNPAQREMLRLIFGEGFPVTAVGDADQTIYEWRGASLENFGDFPRHFPRADGSPAETLYLAHNRRSTTRIIDLANLVRQEIGARSDLERLEPLEGAPPGEVATAWFHGALDEARWVAAEVLRLHDTGDFAWRDMGILFRRHAGIALVRDALERAGVPVEVASLGGLVDVPEVADLHAWLRLIGRPDDTPALMRVLLGARYHLGLGDLAPVAARPSRRSPGDPDDDTPVRGMLEGLDRLEDAPGLSPEAARRLTSFRATHRRLLEEAQGLSLVELCRRILDETGAWPEVEALGDASRLSARLNLYRFLDLAEGWSPLEGAPSLDAFLDYLDLLAEDAASEELDTARVGGEDAVALLTVHRAKGLEWPVVILPNLAEGIFPGGAHAYEDPLAHARFLPYGLRLDAGYLPALPEDAEERKDLLRGRHQDQEWRTAYVAVTRAKQRLVLTGAYWYTESKHRLRSRLFNLANRINGVERRDLASRKGKPPTTRRLMVDARTAAPDPLFSDGCRAALRAAIADPGLPARLAAASRTTPAFEAAAAALAGVLDGLPEPPAPTAAAPAFRTSVTSLVTFASCPLRFHWTAVDRLPRRPSAARRRGVDVHRRIELHHRGGLPPEEADEGLYDLPGADRPGGGDPFAVFAASRFASLSPLLTEAPFELQVGDARLAGRIDAVYAPEPGLWEVVDFKSGARHDDPALRVQLEAYAVAVREAGFTGAPQRARVTFAYLGGGGLEEVSEEVDERWRADARSHLEGLLAAAASGERAAAPSEACRYCDFTRFCAAGTAWVEAHPAD
jgi:DNA helicase-2/ATP-dependent DNA helicase PcrA